jgi:hypothetical protein
MTDAPIRERIARASTMRGSGAGDLQLADDVTAELVSVGLRHLDV